MLLQQALQHVAVAKGVLLVAGAAASNALLLNSWIERDMQTGLHTENVHTPVYLVYVLSNDNSDCPLLVPIINYKGKNCLQVAAWCEKMNMCGHFDLVLICQDAGDKADKTVLNKTTHYTEFGAKHVLLLSVQNKCKNSDS